MPFIRIWVHLVWATKNRANLIKSDIKKILIDHIKENAKTKNIWLDSINCVSDHIHLLVSMSAEQSISKIAMLIKGESSYWMNKQKLIRERFEWQEEYYTVSVGESALNSVRKYIANQEEHHREKSFDEEYESLAIK